MARPLAVRQGDRGKDLDFLRELRRNALERLKAFKRQIDDESLWDRIRENDHLFAAVVETAISHYGITQTELGARLKVSSAAVGRWIKMANLPAPYVRPSVIQTIVQILDEHEKSEKEREAGEKRKGYFMASGMVRH